jgi:hypothetical protein
VRSCLYEHVSWECRAGRTHQIAGCLLLSVGHRVLQDVAATAEEEYRLSTKVRPVSAPEAASWSVVILAAYAVLAALLYTAATTLLFKPLAVTAFDVSLERVRRDMRVTFRLGEHIKGARDTAARRSAARCSAPIAPCA